MLVLPQSTQRSPAKKLTCKIIIPWTTHFCQLLESVRTADRTTTFNKFKVTDTRFAKWPMAAWHQRQATFALRYQTPHSCPHHWHQSCWSSRRRRQRLLARRQVSRCRNPLRWYTEWTHAPFYRSLPTDLAELANSCDWLRSALSYTTRLSVTSVFVTPVSFSVIW